MSLEDLAYCGLYCGACSFKRAHEDRALEHLEAMPDRYDPHKHALPEACPGCRLENQCGPCEIRDCARAKDLLHCGQCPAFPCERLSRFAQDGVPHHAASIPNLQAVRTLGAEAWLAQQAQDWRCVCGSRQSWYLPQCRNAPSGTRRSGLHPLQHTIEAQQAAQLALEAHRRLRAHLPFLPLRSAEDFQPRIAWMITHGSVLGLFQEGVLQAFLGGFILDDYRNVGQAAFCPDWCHGTTEAVSTFDAYRELYRALAPHWRAQGAAIHAIAMHATETEALEALSLTGFGRIMLDAARPVGDLLQDLPSSALGTHRATGLDAEALARLDARLAAHIGASPVLMPDTHGRNTEAWQAWLQEPDTVALVAEGTPDSTGFIKAQQPQFDVTYAVHDPGTLAINGLFVEPAARRRGTAVGLLRQLVEAARNQGKTLMSVDCETLNPEAYGFWIRHFRPVTWSLERRT